MRRILFVSAVFLLMIFACGKKGMEGFVGQEIEVTPQLPEDTLGISFAWTIPDKPKESEITVLSLNPNSRSPIVHFTPDVSGKYKLLLVMTNLDGKEVDKQEFAYEIKEGTPPETKPSGETETTAPQPEPSGTTSTQISESYTPPPPEKQMIPEPRMDLSSSIKTSPKIRPEAAGRIPAVSGKYTIQVSSWKHLKDAEKAMKKLQEQGYDSFVQKAVIDGNEYYRVRVGAFAGYSEAKEALIEFKKTTGLDGWIDKMRKDM